MLKYSRDAVLCAVLCASTVTAWAGPIIIPVPSVSTAAAPAPAYGSPGASTSTAPAAASAPAAGTAPKPAAATPPKPKPDYSHLDVSALLVQPFGDGDVGHGEKVSVSDALSDQAFLILDGARFDSVGEVRRSYDVGVGLNTSDDSGRSFYTTLSWTGVGFAPVAARGEHGHGYALAAGVRVMPLASLQMDAEVRYDNNRVLNGHSSGSIGMLYQFHPRLWLGLTLGTNAMENDYLLTLRWTFNQ